MFRGAVCKMMEEMRLRDQRQQQHSRDEGRAGVSILSSRCRYSQSGREDEQEYGGRIDCTGRNRLTRGAWKWEEGRKKESSTFEAYR
jgi:hypothetical protein